MKYRPSGNPGNNRNLYTQRTISSRLSRAKIPKRRAAARFRAARTPYRAAKRQCCTVVNIERRLIFGVAEQRSAGQRWADYHILRSRSSPDFLELSPSPTTVRKFFKSKWNREHWKNEAFSQQKCPISFPLTQSKSCPDPEFWSALHSGSNPNSTKFVTRVVEPANRTNNNKNLRSTVVKVKTTSTFQPLTAGFHQGKWRLEQGSIEIH